MNIWVNGVFDIIHTGHLDLLWYAKLYGIKELGLSKEDAKKHNKLFVGLDGDERVKKLKGTNRPINDQYERAKIMQNLKPVNSVAIFHDETQLEYFIKKFKIDYVVVGDHYKNKRVVGSEFSKEGVLYYPTDKRSSTNVIKKIKNL